MKRTNPLPVMGRMAFAILSVSLFSLHASAQQFVPSTSMGGSGQYDIVNKDNKGNVGIGEFPGYPDPKEKLTVGGDLALYPRDQYADRRILGYTDNGSLSIYNNTSGENGTGIRLFSRYHNTSHGAVHLIANNEDVNLPNGIGHLMTTYTGRDYLNRFLITLDGLAAIGADVDMNSLFPDDRLTVNNSICLTSNGTTDTRVLRSRTTAGRMDLYAGADLADGPALQLHGTNSSNFLGGAMRFVSKNNFQDGRAFDFSINDGNVNSLRNLMVINRQGRARIGAGDPTSERLTVDGDIYLLDPADGFRDIRARSYSGGLNVRSGGNNTDGSALTLYASNHNTNPGQVLLTARGSSGKAFDFQSYNPNTATAATKLSLDHTGDMHFSGKLQFDLVNNTTPRMIYGKTTASYLSISANVDSDPGGMIQLFSSGHSYYHGAVNFAASGAPTTFPASGIPSPTDVAFEFAQTGPGWNALVDIYKNGKVRIGKDDMTMKGNYKLYVEGGIMTEVVNVAIKNTAAWADYVFDDNYKLMPLQDVATYVKANKHLPDVPAADDVVKDGVNVAEMNAVLLKKVEELTLYVIEQQKLIKEQGKELEKVKAMLPGK